MTKKHFISLADCMREAKPIASAESDRGRQWQKDVEALADWCGLENPRFDRSRWLSYIAGECGPNGGTIKKAS